MLDLILMIIRSLISIRTQAAMAAEIIAPSSDNCDAANPRIEASQAPCNGSLAVGLVLSSVVWLAICSNVRQTRDGPQFGIGEDFAGIGLGRSVTDKQDDLESRRKLVI